MHIPPIYAAAAAIVLTIVATALAVALSVSHAVPLGVAVVVFATGWMGVASAAVFGVLAAALAVVLTTSVWLGFAAGAAGGWYAYRALLYRPAPCRPSAARRPSAGSEESLG